MNRLCKIWQHWFASFRSWTQNWVSKRASDWVLHIEWCPMLIELGNELWQLSNKGAGSHLDDPIFFLLFWNQMSYHSLDKWIVWISWTWFNTLGLSISTLQPWTKSKVARWNAHYTKLNEPTGSCLCKCSLMKSLIKRLACKKYKNTVLDTAARWQAFPSQFNFLWTPPFSSRLRHTLTPTKKLAKPRKTLSFWEDGKFVMENNLAKKNKSKCIMGKLWQND